MTNEHIQPYKINRPMQLLAALLVSLVLIVSIFIGAASVVQKPDWASGLLVVASVLFVPFFLFLIYLLLIKHRDKILADDRFVELEKNRVEAKNISKNLQEKLNTAGYGPDELIMRQAGAEISNELKSELRAETEKLQKLILNIKDSQTQIDPESMLELARGLAVEGKWLDAAAQFDEYIGLVEADWEVYFSRAVAHANVKGDKAQNLRALRAYNDVIAYIWDTDEEDLKARAFSYRGAMLKRLNRLDEAENDLMMAKKLASKQFEIVDILYNLACIYAMKKQKDELLDTLKKLQRFSGAMNLVKARLGTYFANYKEDKDVLQLVLQ